MDQKDGATKQMKWKQISEKERYKIEALRKAKHSIQEIAEQLGRHQRTIQRQLKEKRGDPERYTVAGEDRILRGCRTAST